MELEAIPGVGTKTAASLRELEDPTTAIERGDVATIATAPGISTGKAARIVRGAIRARHDDPGGFLATDRAGEIYGEVLSLLQDRAVTDFATHRLETIYPSAVPDRIEEVQDIARTAMERSIDEEVLAALADVEPPTAPRDVTVRDRCLATTDAETYSTATEAVPEVSVEIVEDARDLAELARGYSTVVALEQRFAGIDVDGDVRVEPDALENPVEIVPERTLSFFAANRASIRNAIAVHRASDLDTDLDLEVLDRALDRLDDDGTVSGDRELERLERATAELDAAVNTAESVANDRLKDAIAEKDVTIEGADLLSLVERGAGVDSLLERELAAEFDDAVEDARDHLIDSLDLREDEADIARRVFPDAPTYPVERDEDAVSELDTTVRGRRDRRATKLKRDLASDLADRRGAVEDLVRDALHLDFELAIARFARDFECTLPERSGRGFEIEQGRCPLLEEPFEEIEPIDYAVDDVAILSGVNSGGKTSTLDLVAVVTVLSHMGLPVPAASARVPEVAELHYYAKTQGTLDAGAFESTLQDFAALTEGTRRKLVLVDELESITEPGASAKIIAGILETLDDGGATAVFVSHLASQIRSAAEFEVTVDGIEALGLEDGSLKVDRSPVKDHLARSTPELIVEKLATGDGDGPDDGEDGDDRDDRIAFYERLLEKF
ncbi:MAG: helix-hairpin-helix domain-containing protein [Halodesulfurarchaeum sp.]